MIMASNITFGYIRVSAKDQNEARQFEKMLELGIDERHIFVDKESGKDFDREKYQAMVAMLREGDLVYVSSIDRLGRNYNEILSQWSLITKEKGADIVVLDMPLLDTRNDRDLTGTLISDIVLQLLSYVAQKERENIRQRQAEGIAIAKANGVYKGRKPIDVDKEAFEKIYAEVLRGERTNNYAMQKLGLKRNTYYKAVNEYKTKTGAWS
jgi:DNA invertase Pin-like site-specific DNA recombinase